MQYAIANLFFALWFNLGKLFAEIGKAFVKYRLRYIHCFCNFLLEWRDHLYVKYDLKRHLSLTSLESSPSQTSQKLTSAPAVLPLKVPEAVKPIVAKVAPKKEAVPIALSDDSIICHHIVPKSRVESDLRERFNSAKALHIHAYHTLRIEKLYHSMFNTCTPCEVFLRIFQYYGFTQKCTALANMFFFCKEMFGITADQICLEMCSFTAAEKKCFEEFMKGKCPSQLLDFLIKDVWALGNNELNSGSKALIEDAKNKLNTTTEKIPA